MYLFHFQFSPDRTDEKRAFFFALSIEVVLDELLELFHPGDMQAFMYLLSNEAAASSSSLDCTDWKVNVRLVSSNNSVGASDVCGHQLEAGKDPPAGLSNGAALVSDEVGHQPDV
jgi:hypothetical protein